MTAQTEAQLHPPLPPLSKQGTLISSLDTLKARGRQGIEWDDDTSGSAVQWKLATDICPIQSVGAKGIFLAGQIAGMSRKPMQSQALVNLAD